MCNIVVCITSPYSKTSVFIRPQVNEWPAFSKSSPWRAFLKRCVFGDRFHRLRVDGSLNRRKKISFFKQERIRVVGASEFQVFALIIPTYFCFVFQSSEVSNPLGDDRFSAMFLNPDFQVDEESEVKGTYAAPVLYNIYQDTLNLRMFFAL